MSIADDVEFWRMALEETKRTVVCHPDRVERLRAAVAEHGLEHRLEVVGSPIIEAESTVYVLDPNAARASIAERDQRRLAGGGSW